MLFRINIPNVKVLFDNLLPLFSVRNATTIPVMLEDKKDKRIKLLKTLIIIVAAYIVGVMLIVNVGFHYLFPALEKEILQQAVSDNFVHQLVLLQQSYFSLHTHKILGALMILVGALQLSRFVRNKYRKIHKALGYVYVLSSLLVTFTAFILAIRHAFGGAVEQWLNIVTSILFLATLYIGIKAARSGDYQVHRAYMIRNFALLCFAPTFRFIATVGHNLGVSNDVLLFNASWLIALFANMAVAELYVRASSDFRLDQSK